MPSSIDLSINVASTGNGTIAVDLSWNPSVFTGASAIVKASLLLTQSIVSGSSTVETITKVDVTGLTSYTFTGLTNGQGYVIVYQIQSGTPASGTTVTTTAPPVSATPATVPNVPVISNGVALDDALSFQVTFPTNGGSAYTIMEVVKFGNDNTCQTLFVDISNITTVGQSQSYQFTDGVLYGGVSAEISNFTTYVLAVYTYNAKGTSAISNTLEITPTDEPSAPTNIVDIAGSSASFAAQAATGAVGVKWRPPADAGFTNPPPIGYTIVNGYRIDISSATTLQSISLLDASYNSVGQSSSTDMSYSIPSSYFTVGTSYWVGVRATNNSGTTWGDISYAVPQNIPTTPGVPYVVPFTVPAAPTGLTVTYPACDLVKFAWTAPASNGGYALTTYDLSVNGSVYNPAASDLSYTITLSAAAAVANIYGTTLNSSSLNTSNSTTWDSSLLSTNVQPYCVPSAVSAPFVNPEANSVEITWDAPNANGSSITNYVIELSGNGLDISYVRTPASTSLEYEWTDLSNGVGYQFRIYAINARGTSSAGAWSSVVTPVTSPGQPQNLQAIQTGISAETLTWNPPSDLSNGTSGGSTIDYFYIYTYSSTSDTTPVYLDQVASPAGLSNEDYTFSYVNTGLTIGTTYKRGVATHTTSGEISSIQTITFTLAAVPDVVSADLSGTSKIIFTVNSRGIPLINYTAYARPAAALPSGSVPYKEGTNTETGTAIQIVVDFGYTLATTTVGSTTVPSAYLFSVANANGIGDEYSYVN